MNMSEFSSVPEYMPNMASDSPQGVSTDDSFNIDADLSIFTNTQFFDFESGQNTDFAAKSNVDNASPTDLTVTAPPSTAIPDLSNMDFVGDYGFSDFTAQFPVSQLSTIPESISQIPSASAGATAGGTTASTPATPATATFQQAAAPAYAAPASKPKRKTSEAPAESRVLTAEEQSRLAAEEDKRRRNTAASARFRIKKKQREQALEKTAKEMSEKVTTLETKVQKLETENKWLKSLIMEKHEGNEDIPRLWKEFSSQMLSEKGGSGPSAEEASIVKKERDEPA